MNGKRPVEKSTMKLSPETVRYRQAADIRGSLQSEGILILLDEFVPRTPFSVIGELDDDELLNPIEEEAPDLDRYQPYVIGYEFPASPRYAIVFIPNGTSLSTDDRFEFRSDPAFFVDALALLEASVSQVAEEQEETQTSEETPTEPVTLQFDATSSQWRGRTPESISGEVNPTLELESGRSYEVIFTNLDGLTHQFVVATDDDEPVVSSSLSRSEGENVSFTFTATDEMAQYFCDVHPEQANGDIMVKDN